MPPPLRILCFGDSLTEGYTRFGTRYTPYSRTLRLKLTQHFDDDDKSIVIDTHGASGETVTEDFADRISWSYPGSTEDERGMGKYDWLIYLGGTNDLAWGFEPASIYAAIREQTEWARLAGAKVLLLTVPECAVKSEGLDRKRGVLNDLIKADERGDVFCFDMHGEMPYRSLSEEEKEAIWDDGLHFTERGYRLMGEKIAGRLISLLESEEDLKGT